MTDTLPTPAKIWNQMVRGNARFVAGEPRHPRQDVERRAELALRQAPTAAIFGCSDSRLAAEIIFDKGLGDLFVVRNAGQVTTNSAIGSLEYAVSVLGVPLILVLAHDECGAVRAAIDSRELDGPLLPVHVAELVNRIVPAVDRVRAAHPGSTEPLDATEVGREHLRGTVAQLLDRSELISESVAHGTLGIVGANYRLLEGTAVPDIVVGNL